MQWPYLTLGLSEDADDATVRDAYMRAVRETPPEKDAARFSAIQQAHDLLKTQEARTRLKLFGLPEKPSRLAELIPDESHLRKIIPMEIWLQELRESRK